MLFELRQYQCHPGQREKFVELMESQIIPFQIAQGMSIVGSFVAEEDPNLYVWIRRFDDEEARVALYQAVYESDHWKNDIAPQIPDLLDRESINVTRLNPTGASALH